MNKFTPSLTADHIYTLSLVAINQHGSRCDLIWCYIDDAGDEMFLRQFIDNFQKHVRKTVFVDALDSMKNVERSFYVRGCFQTFNAVARLAIKAKLALVENPNTGRNYTVITSIISQCNNEYTMCARAPYFWLTDEVFYGPASIKQLDDQYVNQLKQAHNEVDKEIEYLQSPGFEVFAESASMGF